MGRKKKTTKKRAPARRPARKRSKLAGYLKEVQSKRHGTPCFAANVGGEAKKFLDEISRMEQAGEFLNKSRAHEIFMQEFGGEIGLSVFTKHLRGGCKCNER